MAYPKDGNTSKPAEYKPDWVVGHQGAISEVNWAEFEAKGFIPLGKAYDDDPDGLESAQRWYGTEHVYTGDRYDYDARRPLRHKPGISIYVDPEGEVIGDEKLRKAKDHHNPPPQADEPGNN